MSTTPVTSDIPEWYWKLKEQEWHKVFLPNPQLIWVLPLGKPGTFKPVPYRNVDPV